MSGTVEPAKLDWTLRGRIDLVTCDLTGPWIMLAEIVADATLLKITAGGAWHPLALPGITCGPDGLAGLHFQSDGLMLAEAPPGALIGKIGGGSVTSAGWSAGGANTGIGLDGKPFGVGTFCILQIPRQVIGPIFIGVNMIARPIPVQTLSVCLETSLAPATSPPK